MKEYRLQDWLPTTRKEMDLRGWDYVDVILFSGDAYVDHPSFGAAVIGRTLEGEPLYRKQEIEERRCLYSQWPAWHEARLSYNRL